MLTFRSSSSLRLGAVVANFVRSLRSLCLGALLVHDWRVAHWVLALLAVTLHCVFGGLPLAVTRRVVSLLLYVPTQRRVALLHLPNEGALNHFICADSVGSSRGHVSHYGRSLDA